MSYCSPHCSVIPELVIRSRILTESIFGDRGKVFGKYLKEYKKVALFPKHYGAILFLTCTEAARFKMRWSELRYK